MAYLTAGNGTKQPPSNHGNNRQERNPAPPESREQNSIHPVEQADNKASHLSTKHSSHDAPCSSTTLQKRDIKIQQCFYQLIHPSTFREIERKADRNKKKYNGIFHSQYALSIKNFTLTNQKEPLNVDQLNQLLPLLKSHHPKSDWIWLNLSTPLHSWTTAGLFAHNKDLCPQAQKAQNHLLNAFLGQVLERHKTSHLLPGLHARSLSSLLSHLTQLMDQGLPLETPSLKEAVIILLQHVKTIDESPNDCFMEKPIINLLWSMITLVKKGLKPEETPELKSSVTIMWKSVAEQDSLTYNCLGNLIRIITNLAECRLLEDTREINHSATLLLLIVETQKEQFDTNTLSYILWSIKELGVIGNSLRLLDTKTIKKTHDIAFALSHRIETDLKSKKNYDICDKQYIASTLRAITELMKGGIAEEGTSEDASELSQSLTVLCPLVVKIKRLFTPKELSNMMVAIATLGERKLTPNNTKLLKNTADALLHLVITNAKSKSFHPLDIVDAVHSIASLRQNKLLEVALTINQSMVALLPLIVKHEQHFTTKNRANLLQAVSRLCDCHMALENNDHLKAILLTLLPLMETEAKLAFFTIKQIVIILCSVAKLMDSSQELDTQKLSPLVTLLLPQIIELSDNMTTPNIANLLCAMTKLMKFMMELKDSLNFKTTVAFLLSKMETKAESEEDKKYLTRHYLLCDIATFSNQGLPLNTQYLKKIVTKLLLHMGVQKYPLTPQYIADTLWAVALLGELIEIKVAVTFSASLIGLIDTYDPFTQSEKMMSIWGMIACSARAQLFSSDCTAECAVLQTHIQQLFNIMNNSTLELEYHKRTMALASAWLGESCSVSPNYDTIKISNYQCALHQALRKKLPSLIIEEEKVLDILPPVDLYLPDHNIVIEIQGPSHYIGDDLQTRNGSTLLKIALLKKMRCNVIELPGGLSHDKIAIQKNIDKIQERIQVAEEPLDDEYFSAEETINYSDTLSLETTETSIKTEQQPKEALTRKKKKKRDRRNKTQSPLLPHSL